MGSSPATATINSKPHSLKKINIHESMSLKYRQYIHAELPVQETDLLCIQKILSSHSIFSQFPEELIELCISKVTKWKYSGGFYIYRQHDVAGSLYMIKDGGVFVEIDCNIVKTLSENDYFGHDTLCFQALRSESIRVASQQLILYQLKKQEVLGLIQKWMQTYRQHIISLFSKIHFFNYLTNKEKEFIIKNTFLFRFKSGETLFEKDQEANSFFIVSKGAVKIEITGKQDIIMFEGDYFGETAFLSMINSKKPIRIGKASAISQTVEVYGVGLSNVKESLGHQIRSIIFFNQQRWSIFRDPFLKTLKDIDHSYLLQLFCVKEGRKFTILAKQKERPKYLFIPLEVEINKSKELKLYCSEYLREENKDKLLVQDIIITEPGYYAYASIEEFKAVLALGKTSFSQKQMDVKLNKQPIYKILTLSLRNISKYSKKIPSSQFSTVLIIQDMKFGGEFLLKIYRKKIRTRQMTDVNNLVLASKIRESRLRTSKVINGNSATSLKGVIEMLGESKLKGEAQKLQVNEAMVLREMQIMSSLNSPYVCGFYKGQQDNNHYYLFIEYLIGLTLQQLMFDLGTLPQSLQKYFLASIAAALDYLHTNRVIYRNLNPSNIMIKSSGHLVLTDFSCSKRVASGRTSSLAGVPYYMAPEVIQRKDYTFSADVWSMGVVLYEMMSGSLPFGEKADSILEIYDSILKEEVDLSIIGSKNGKELVNALLQKDENKRISSSLAIRQFNFINDIEFDWNLFLSGQMNPFYFPIKRSFDYSSFNNAELFDVSTVRDFY